MNVPAFSQQQQQQQQQQPQQQQQQQQQRQQQQKSSPRFGKDSRESYIQIHVHRKLHAHVSKLSDEDGKFDRFLQFALVILFWIH